MAEWGIDIDVPDTRSCTAHSKPQGCVCDAFWTEWGDCNAVCFGGEQTRRFEVPGIASRLAHCAVEHESWIGDGYCDFAGLYNTRVCNWDGGDCCSDTCDGSSFYGCENTADAVRDGGCWDPNADDYDAARLLADCLVPYPSRIGDGVCDDAVGLNDAIGPGGKRYFYNTHACGWDGGDCCESTCSVDVSTCKSTCFGETCNHWVSSGFFDCAELSSTFGCSCDGCDSCPASSTNAWTTDMTIGLRSSSSPYTTSTPTVSFGPTTSPNNFSPCSSFECFDPDANDTIAAGSYFEFVQEVCLLDYLLGNETRECSDDAYSEQCDAFSCDELWSNWTECTRICSNGTQTRSFVVPLDAEHQRFYHEVCVPSGGYPENGASETRSCEEVEILFGSDIGGYPKCSQFNCFDWFGNWTECDAFCEGGFQTREFVVPLDVDAQAYNAEVCQEQRSQELFWDNYTFPEDGGTDRQTCEFVFEINESAQAYPRCDLVSCEEFWTSWTKCNRVCSGGTQTRYFKVSNSTLDLEYNEEVCQQRYGQEQYAYPVNGGNETLPCEDVLALGFEEGGYPECTNTDCRLFFGEWTPCTRLCPTTPGTRNRSLDFSKFGESGKKYYQEVCLNSEIEGYDSIYPPIFPGTQVASCEDVADVEGVEAYPDCNASKCNDWWATWSLCTEPCGPATPEDEGGNMTRMIYVPNDEADRHFYETECRLLYVDDFDVRYPAVDANGTGSITLPCELVPSKDGGGYPLCAAFIFSIVGQVAGTTVVVLACAIAAVVVHRHFEDSAKLRQSARGKHFLRVANYSMRKALSIWRAQHSLSSLFPDMSLRSVMFALKRGKRRKSKAHALLLRADRYLRQDKNTSVVEALERAEWFLERNQLTALHFLLLKEVPDKETFQSILEEMAAGGGIARMQSSFATAASSEFINNDAQNLADVPYVHIACCTRWEDDAHQAWTVDELMRKLPKIYSLTEHKPTPSRRKSRPMSLLEFAVHRKCDPDVLKVILHNAPELASRCPSNLFVRLIHVHPTEAEKVASVILASFRARLRARIKNRWWLDDENSEAKGNGVPGFIPPSVKVRAHRGCFFVFTFASSSFV